MNVSGEFPGGESPCPNGLRTAAQGYATERCPARDYVEGLPSSTRLRRETIQGGQFHTPWGWGRDRSVIEPGQAAFRPAPGSFVLFDDFDDSLLPEATPTVYEILAELPVEWRVVGQAGSTMMLQFHGKGIAEDRAA